MPSIKHGRTRTWLDTNQIKYSTNKTTKRPNKSWPAFWPGPAEDEGLNEQFSGGFQAHHYWQSVQTFHS